MGHVNIEHGLPLKNWLSFSMKKQKRLAQMRLVILVLILGVEISFNLYNDEVVLFCTQSKT